MSFTLCDILNIKYPIVQGAMAWVANAALAASVSEAGGLGIIAAGDAPLDVVLTEIRTAKKLTNNPFAVNIMLLSKDADEVVKLVVNEGVKVVTTGAGNPGKYMETFKANGIKVLPVVPSVAFAKKMEKLGADAVIAEGMESGGHIGKLTTMALTPQVVNAVNIPVVTAGGVADGRGLAAAIMLGAAGVQIGTRFLVSTDCTIHQNYKNAVLKAKDIDTTVTGVRTGHPVRVIKNMQSKLFDQIEKTTVDDTEISKKFDELGEGALRRAVIDGDTDTGSLMSGQIAGLVNKEQSSKEIVLEIMEEFYNLMEDRYKKFGYCKVAMKTKQAN